MANVSVPVITDNIVELQEQFDLILNVPSSLGPGIEAGALTRVTATIIDTSSRLHHIS